MGEDTITISRSVYEDLLETQRWIDCLDAAGVDNWVGIDMAQEMFGEGDQ